MINPEHQIFPNVHYIHKLDHRNRSQEKSQWIISEADEQQCFRFAYDFRPDIIICWGLHLEDNTVVYLGVTKNQERDLFIAKFIDSNENNKWHGYPADHVLNEQDIPPASVLNLWSQRNYLNLAKIRKISKGQPCKL